MTEVVNAVVIMKPSNAVPKDATGLGCEWASARATERLFSSDCITVLMVFCLSDPQQTLCGESSPPGAEKMCVSTQESSESSEMVTGESYGTSRKDFSYLAGESGATWSRTP